MCEDAAAWISRTFPDGWYKAKGLWYVYYINALAECGLGEA